MIETSPHPNDVHEYSESYGFPISYAQQRLWVVDQLAKDAAAYNIPSAYRLRGPLSLTALETALQGLIDRHESLRTSFDVDSGELVQIVHNTMKVALTIDDLRKLPGPDRNRQKDKLIHDEANRPFDLANDRLIRSRLIKLKEHDHVLLLTTHHIISDGWSVGVLENDLHELYKAAVNRTRPALSLLPIQYPDYSVWQRDWLTGDVLERQLQYWRERLRDVPILQLPTDFSRPSIQTFDGASIDIDVPKETADKLREVGKRSRATLFITALSAFYILLSRYSGQNDIAIGSPVAGRNKKEVEGLIGFFVNSLVLKIKTGDNDCFIDVQNRVRDLVLEALSHQDLPFEKLVAELMPSRDTDRNPLFQVMFSLQYADTHSLALENLEVDQIRIPSLSAKVDLTMFVKEFEDKLSCRLNYNTNLFKQETAELMLRHYRVLLQDIAAHPDKPISDLQLLDGSERATIVERWNATETNYPKAATLNTLFAETAACQSDAVAVSDHSGQLTYGDLDRRSNQLAHYLIECGVETGQPVGLAGYPSRELLIGLLAIVKAGGIYLPIDPAYPRSRREYMVEDAGVESIVTNEPKVIQDLNARSRIIDISKDGQEIQRQPVSLPKVALCSTDLAYIIYTSGSTGDPKGVCVTHRAITRLVIGTNYIDLDEHDRVAQLSNICFDAATFEIWGALLSGARLEIFDKGTVVDAKAFAEQLSTRQISATFITTALFNNLANDNPKIFQNVGTVMFGGENVDVDVVKKVLAAGKPEKLIHVYGPTECTTFATFHEVTSADTNAWTIPIGRPISNTKAYVLDSELNVVSPGVVGELYLAGDGLAREYLNQPELTAQRFITSPFKNSERLYRTGDLVRFRADGAIDFVGRTDNQVKIRGYRIEPSEIEAQLNKRPDVTSSLVIVDQTRSGENRLVAYVVPTKGCTLQGSGLRDHLKSRLPDFMLPAAIVPVECWPLNTSGKIDRTALPRAAPELSQQETKTRPQTQMQLHLCKIWEDALGIADVAVSDNFFDLGGHSLTAVRLVDAIERMFGKRIPMDTLWYGGGTIEDLAKILEQEQTNVRWPTLVPMHDYGELAPLFCVHTMGGNLFHYDNLIKELHPELPVYGLQAKGVYGKDPPRTSIEDIASDCIHAMRSRQPSGPYQIVGFSSGGVVAYEMAQQLLRSNDSVAPLILIDTILPPIARTRRLVRRIEGLKRCRTLRDFQERLYHVILHTLGLGRLRDLVQIGEAHRWAHWSYRPSPYLGDVTLFVAEEENQHGWRPIDTLRPLVGGNLVAEILPGKHGEMVKHPHVKSLARYLSMCLERQIDKSPR